MKKRSFKKLSLNKLKIARLNNLDAIRGGSDTSDVCTSGTIRTSRFWTCTISGDAKDDGPVPN